MYSHHERDQLLDVIERRIDVLDSLAADRKDKRELVAELDCSRSTVDRSVRELESHDLVAYDDGEYRTTTFGQLAAEEYRRFERRVETVERLQPAFEWLPFDEFELDLGCLADADLVVSTPADPYAPANRHADVLAESKSFRGLLPAVGLNQLEVGREAVIGAEREQTLIVDAAVAKQLRTKPHYTEKVGELLASGRVDVRVYDGTIPYFLGLYDETVHVGVEDEDGMPRALVETDADEAYEWAESVYADYRRDTRKFEGVRTA